MATHTSVKGSGSRTLLSNSLIREALVGLDGQSDILTQAPLLAIIISDLIQNVKPWERTN